MRDFKGMKRQRGRNRSGNPNAGGGKPQQNANRAFDSTGPENIKVRGHAQHVFEKYQQLARDATSSGDRVLAENFLQHAEHYFRVLRTLQPNRPVSDFMARDTYNSNYDIDFEDESGAQADPEPTQTEGQSDSESNAQGGQNGERQDYQNRDSRDQNGYRDNRDQNQNRNDQNRGDRQNRNRYEGDRNQNQYRDRDQNRDQNQNRDRSEFRRDERPARTEGEQPSVEARDERPREDRSQQQREPREYRGDRNEGRRERSYEPRGERIDPLAVVEPRAAPLTPASERASEPETGGVLRSQDGGVSHAPAFLQAAPAPAAEEAPVKRSRGRPKKVAEPAGEGA